jgi:O-antigen/teichoic acid export membrane protein
MSLGHSIRSGVKWLMVGKVGSRFMEFAFGVVLARLLVPADFGMIATVAVFTGFVGMFTAGGMGQSLIRAKTADQNDFTAVFTLQLAMGVAVYLGFFIAAPWIARLFEDPLYADLIRVSALSFLLRPFLVMRNAWLNREMNFKSRSIVDVTGGLVTGIAGTLMAWAGMGVWSLTLSGLIAAVFKNIWLARLTPLKLRLNMDVTTMRKHSMYGFKIMGNDFVTYLRTESKSLILSKLAGPSFLGLFKKAESLSRLPNQLVMSATMDPVFRAMSKVQDDLDQTKYMFYRTITLLIAYTTPLYVLLWWIAEPFVGFVYGEKWLQAGAPMSILAIAGVFLNIIFPCSVVLAAQNRLGKEMLAQTINLVVIVVATYVGLGWGLEGVAWGIVFSQVLLAVHFYWLVYETLPTRVGDLVRAAAPGLFLSTLLAGVLSLINFAFGEHQATMPFLYLLAMTLCGGLFYAAAFLFIPIAALHTEAERWRQKLGDSLSKIKKPLS